MARIAGVDIPDNKRGEIALTYIYGIGRRSAQNILHKVGVNLDKKAKEWNDEESNAIRAVDVVDRKALGLPHLHAFGIATGQ